MEEDTKDKISEVLSANHALESGIALALGLPTEEVIAILKSDRHRFKRTGFMRLGKVIDHEWAETRIYKAERCGRKTAPRVRGEKGRRRWGR